MLKKAYKFSVVTWSDQLLWVTDVSTDDKKLNMNLLDTVCLLVCIYCMYINCFIKWWNSGNVEKSVKTLDHW